MLPTDSLDAARAMASEMSDPRVRHYYDPRGTRLAGAALAHGIIGEGRGPAWTCTFSTVRTRSGATSRRRRSTGVTN